MPVSVSCRQLLEASLQRDIGMLFSQCYWINKLLQPGRHQRCFVYLVIDAVKRQFLETQQIPVDTSESCMFLHYENSSSEAIKKSGSYFFTETQLQNMRLFFLSCPSNIDKHLVGKKVCLTDCLTRGKWDQKRGCLQITSSKKIFSSNKIFNIGLLSLILKGT